MPRILPKYIAVYNRDRMYCSKAADNVKELLVELLTEYAANTHDDSINIDLFKKALNGLGTNDDAIALFHQFSSRRIKNIYEINKTVYSDNEYNEIK